MIYVGKSNDNNLWNLSTIAALFPKWDENAEIDNSQTIAGDSRPRASFRPALAVFNNHIHMVYAGNEGRNLWWASQPNGPWHNRQLPWSGTNFNPQPSLAVHEGKLFLAWYDYVRVRLPRWMARFQQSLARTTFATALLTRGNPSKSPAGRPSRSLPRELSFLR
jgi:hypothetical protein